MLDSMSTPSGSGGTGSFIPETSHLYRRPLPYQEPAETALAAFYCPAKFSHTTPQEEKLD